MAVFWVYDRWGAQKGTVTDLTEAIHIDELNGEDSLTLVMPTCELVKGDRIVWRDAWDAWHEHIVTRVGTIHSQGIVQDTVYCENSLSELHTDHIDDLRPYNVTASVALQRALSVTKWAVGTVTVTSSGSTNFYHISAFDAVKKVLDEWGGEYSTTISVDASGVTSRALDLLARRGVDGGKMFTYTRDIVTLSRTVDSDDVFTAMYGYGCGLENIDEDGQWTGGYERKLTFGDINGGKDYVEDNAALVRWGLPDGNGGIKHAFGRVDFPDCDDEAELLQLTTDYLQTVSSPRVEYSLDAVNLADAGFTADEVRTGDTVTIRDKVIDERLSGRILKVERHLVEGKATRVTVGNISRSFTGLYGAQAADIQWMMDHSASWDAAAVNTTTYLDRLMQRVNDNMNVTGGYTYWEQGNGIITYDRPVDQNPTMAIQITGAGFRIANSKNPDQSWHWRTFGTGAGFTADEIVSGTLSTILLQSLDQLNWWNLATSEAHFDSASLTIGNSPAASQAYVTATNDALKSLIADESGWSQIEQTPGGLYAIVESVDSDAAAAQAAAEAAELKATAKSATSSTAAATAAKVAACTGFSLFAGAVVSVLFSNANTAASPTLNVNGTGAKAIWVHDAATSADNPLLWTVGALVTFRYDGTRWRLVDVPGDHAADCLTAAATAAKTTAATVSPEGFVIVNGTTVEVGFTSENTATGVTLDVAGTGAAAVWTNGAPVTSSNPLAWIAGGSVVFVRNGAAWQVSDMLDSSYMRQYGDGVLVGRPGNGIAALVNSRGSFDVVEVTWNGGIPTAGDALAIMSRYGIGFYDGSGNALVEMSSEHLALGPDDVTRTEVSNYEEMRPLPAPYIGYEDLTGSMLRLMNGTWANGRKLVDLYADDEAVLGVDERGLVFYDGSGNTVFRILCEVPGTSNTGNATLTIDVDADVTISQAAAWLAALGAVAKAGDTMTGDLIMSSKHVIGKSGNIDPANPPASSSKWGSSRLVFKDKDDTTFFQLSPIHSSTDGRLGVVLYPARTVNGAQKTNALYLLIDSSGNPYVSLQAVAWLKALGLGTDGVLPVTIAQGGTGATTAAAARTALGVPATTDLDRYLPITGGTVTGNIRRKDSVMDKSASSLTSGRYASYIVDDKNGDMIGMFQTVQGLNGNVYVQILSRHSVAGSDIDNYLRLYVTANGTRIVDIPDPAIWLDALGIAETEDQTASLFTAGAGFATSSLRVSKAGGICQLTLNVKSTNALTAGSSYTLGTLAAGNRPPSMVYGAVFQGGVVRLASTGVATYVPTKAIAVNTTLQMSLTYVVAN